MQKNINKYVNKYVNKSLLFFYKFLNFIFSVGEVYICVNGGYGGYLSSLEYYDYGLGISEIESINKKGANLKMIDKNGTEVKSSNYLSLRWFFYGMNDSYNP